MSWFYRKEIKWNVYWKLQATWNYFRKNKRLKEEVICLKCGYTHYVDRPSLLSGNCWCRKCSHLTHWLANGRFYQVWKNMTQRCNNPKNKGYYLYWKRGIKCERNTFDEFKADMYESYEEHCKKYWEKETSIDRINVNWNYCKWNCRWATNIEQANNTRRNSWVYDFARKTWIPRNRVAYWFYYKWLTLNEIKEKFS